jgi:voltage-gated sodium channel
MPRNPRLPSTDDREQLHASSRIVRTCARTADATWFNVTIFAIILVNAVVLGLGTYDSIENDYGDALHLANEVILGIFVVEIAIRITGFGRRPQDYFKSGWNVFDFVIVGASFVPGIRENATLLRLIRLARVLRVVRLLPDLRVLTVAVGRSLPGVASLAVLTVLLVFVYGMVGWVLFGDEDPGFADIGNAMLTLFVTMTLENFPDQLEAGRAVSDWAIPYYLSYVLIGAFLVLNLLIGVVISSMEQARDIEAERELGDRLEHGEAAPEPELADRLAGLRGQLEAVERELRAAEGVRAAERS